MSLSYISNNGTVIEFGSGSAYYADPDVFRGYDEDYSTLRNSVVRFSKKVRSVEMPILISADTEKEGARLLDVMDQAFIHDIMANTPGKIVVDGYYARAFIQSVAMSCADSVGLYEIELSTSVLIPNPVWILEDTHEYSLERGSSIRGLNYSHNYPYNYCSGSITGLLKNPLSWPCAVKIIVYGPASNPAIYIGDNLYEVDVEVPAGGYLVIDGMDKSKISLRNRLGEESNVFRLRAPGSPGSGSYVFERVPAGTHRVTWNGTFGFSLILYHERGMPPCLT